MNAHAGQEHQDARLSLGAYVLGGLGPAERAEVERHVSTCPACQAELAGLAVVPGLLRRIEPLGRPTTAATAGSRRGSAGRAEPAPEPDALPRLLEQVRAERARQGKQTRRLRAIAVTAGVAAAAALALTVAPAGTVRSEPAGPITPAGPAADIAMAPGTGAATGRAGLEGRAWGTAVSLDLQRLPAGTSFVAWAVADDGRREQAASWGPTPTGAARLSGATAIPRAQLARLEVVTATGVPVLTAVG